MNTKQLLIFKHFVEAQNENAVAEKLGITQPTVTFHLKNLSKECGLPLYFKKGKHFNLTEAGELLYRNANKMLNLIEETTDMMEDFKQSKRGTLRIGASHAPIYSILPSTFKNYMHEHPNIDINLTVDTAPIIIEKVKNRKIDIAVIAEKGFNEGELQVKRLHENPLVLAMDKRHPLAQKNHLTLEDISRYRFIIHNSGANRDSILTTIKDSNYLSLVSKNAMSHHPSIISKTLPNAPTTSYISLIYRNDRHLTSIIQDFITLIYNTK